MMPREVTGEVPQPGPVSGGEVIEEVPQPDPVPGVVEWTQQTRLGQLLLC